MTGIGMAGVRRLIGRGLLMVSMAAAAAAQPPGGPRPPAFESSEVAADRRVTFRIHAPKAEAVRLASPDLPDAGRGVEMQKGDEGVWAATVGPVPAGAYRYHFQVDGLAVIDPRNPATSEANSNTFSLVVVPGSEPFDLRDVPHGAVAEVTYHSKTLGRPRRMHVYTPPGYESGEGRYPVFYLLHGATDSDASWSTVGRAGVILDNLIAAGKARPMIVVMPAGHTGPFRFGPPGENSFEKQMAEFVGDFRDDIRPYIERTYRVLDGPSNRAIAGLSMGGAQTLDVAFGKPEDYGHVGVFSSGVFGIAGGFGGQPPNTKWEEDHAAALDAAARQAPAPRIWLATGKDDFLVETSRKTAEMLKKHGLDVTYEETDGGHTWLNWRDYLATFAPMLFQGG
jgi:enterochelin esterase family protein